MMVRVIGIGNPDRGDDAAGCRVLAALNVDPPSGSELTAGPADMLALLDRWTGAEAVILIDAIAPGAKPGRIVRIDAGSAAVKPALDNFASSHAFNLAEAIELARALDRLPPRLTVFGVVGESFAPGAALSAAVAGAIPELTRLVREEVAVCTKLR